MNRMTRLYTGMGFIAILYLFCFFLYPLLKVFYTSLWINDQFTFDNYIKILTTSIYTQVLMKTLSVAVISTVIALGLGYLMAYFIVTRRPERQGIWLLIVVSSMFMSLTVRLYGWLIILGENSPILKALTSLFGKIQLLFSEKAIVVGIVHFILPFVTLTIYTSLKKIEPSLLEASNMLGASPLRTFWRITFPLSLPGIYAGGSIAFALSASTFLVPIMLGGGPKNYLIANIAYDLIVTVGNLDMGAALSFVLFVMVILILSIFNLLERRGQHAPRKMD
ncbi:putative spermidine/putrescine transport system permease protein/spermidine/putrescine transport system permease protein [Seinonella peptonophila]|uniref:Putative spermidine/putrescine transport system permease protein/spermidine/putrescine transport system permease protein n=1 Tax=Seinonella peptonophila TaxID=112248 RepID=A0A1M4SPH7_9BACL|nr:ABC transporter permease [Seinonella peptonophila]SHE34069.1 putative spermidine/putrescine transport system permease protein/spermidine/putrescine transport system permease protein [Seinonella peptonophila]